MSNADNLERIGHAMMLAWSRVKRAQSRSWGEWMTIGEGLLEGRRWAMAQAGVNSPEGKGYTLAFGEWLRRFHVEDMDKGDRAKLLQLMEERPAVEEWRAVLTDHERRNLNNPTVAWRKWTAATRVKKSRPKPAHVTTDALQARVAELEEELAGREPAQPQEIERLQAEIKMLNAELDEWMDKAVPYLDFSGDPALCCSFCGKDRTRIEKLIAAPPLAGQPKFNICNECVDLCSIMITTEAAGEAPPKKGRKKSIFGGVFSKPKAATLAWTGTAKDGWLATAKDGYVYLVAPDGKRWLISSVYPIKDDPRTARELIKHASLSFSDADGQPVPSSYPTAAAAKAACEAVSRRLAG